MCACTGACGVLPQFARECVSLVCLESVLPRWAYADGSRCSSAQRVWRKGRSGPAVYREWGGAHSTRWVVTCCVSCRRRLLDRLSDLCCAAWWLPSCLLSWGVIPRTTQAAGIQPAWHLWVQFRRNAGSQASWFLEAQFLCSVCVDVLVFPFSSCLAFFFHLCLHPTFW